MAASKPRPDHVPEENVYNGVHWMIVVTYVAAIGGVAALLMNAGWLWWPRFCCCLGIMRPFAAVMVRRQV